MPYIRIIEGVQCSETGIPLEMGIRCAHGVVDGDKPLAQSGPRCLECRKTWYPTIRMADYGRGLKEYRFCSSCGEDLHITYFPTRVESYGPEGQYLGSKQGYEPGRWSHGDSGYGCKHSGYPVDGFEKNYGQGGWGHWEEYSARLIRELHDGLERDMRFKETYGRSRGH